MGEVEVPVVRAAESGVETAIALVVVSANVVDQVETVIETDASRILAAIGDCSLALAGSKVEVLVVATLAQGVDTVSALEVVSAEGVHQIEAVGLANTLGVLAASWDRSLAGALGEVVVFVGSAVETGVETIVALVVGLAKVVDKVESIGDVVATRILATSWDSSLALTNRKVEVSIVGTGKASVESVSTLVV